MRIVLLAPSTIVTACTIAPKGAAQSHLSNAGDVPPGPPPPTPLYIDANISEWMGGIDHSQEQENVLVASHVLHLHTEHGYFSRIPLFRFQHHFSDIKPEI